MGIEERNRYKMKVLVTGANGYLGTGVVKQLCDDGVDVIAVCHSRTDNVDQRAEIKQCDIFSIEDPFFELGEPDVLLHMAWRNGFVHNAPSHINDSNLIGRIIKDKSDACYGGYQQQVGNAFIPQVNPLSGRTYGKNEILHDFIPRMCGKLDYHIVDEVQMSVCMAMFSMEIIRENQIKCHSERELISEDFVFNLDFLEHAKKISISDSCGYYYRDNVASLTKVYQPNRLEKQVYFTKYIIERIKSLNIYDECIQRIYSTFFAWVRNIVKREQRFYRQIGFVHSLNNIKRVCDDPFVVMALKIYDDSNLTRNPALLNKLIRKKRILEIWLLSYIKEKTRK